MGQSDFQPERRIEHWPDDVMQLASALELKKFAVLGVSGGAPYAMACAVRFPERVTALGLVSAVAPLDAAGLYRLARHAPWLLRGLLRLMRRAARSTSERLAASFPEPDRRALQRPEVRKHLSTVLGEAMRQGVQGVARDMQLIAQPWGFDLAQVQTPVLLWHGEQDRNVPVAHGRHLLNSLPNCRATFYPHEAHLSLFINQGRELLRTLVLGL
jgi:pimeloyl-ACP methyl ester carboxylesterase